MKRDIEKLSSQIFDILIIGGGIHGAAVAREASRKGFKTALIEMNDFGHSTSFNSMKVIHGGLRYLQHGNLKRIRQSIRSRKIMQNVAPHLIKAVPFLVPTYGYGIKSKTIMRIALLINDIISFDRNYNINSQNHIPGGKVIDKKKILALLPGINKEKLTGGAIWYEAVVQNTERVLLEFLYDAYNYDFTSANYIEAIEFINGENEIKGVKVRDIINSNEFNIYCKICVNAVGPWFNLIQNSLKLSKQPKIELTKAVNIIVNKKIFSEYSVGLEGKESFSDTDAFIKRGKRLFFFVPIENYTMIGTSYKLYRGEINNFEITKEDIQEIINEVNYLYPSIGLTFNDVSFYHAGLLPLEKKSDPDNVQSERHSVIYDYEDENNLKNLFSIKSVKYTTAPVIAEDVVKMIKRKIKPASITKNQIKFDFKYAHGDMSREILESLTNKYGAHSNEIFKLIEEDKSYLNLVSFDPPLIVAEIIYALRNEMALTLKDVVLRRTGMGMLRCPSLESIANTAVIISSELGWDKAKEASEIDSLLQVYFPMNKFKKAEF